MVRELPVERAEKHLPLLTEDRGATGARNIIR